MGFVVLHVDVLGTQDGKLKLCTYMVVQVWQGGVSSLMDLALDDRVGFLLGRGISRCLKCEKQGIGDDF